MYTLMAPLNFMQSLVLFLGILAPAFKLTAAQTIGVCNGRIGDNNILPSQEATVNLYVNNNIRGMRLYEPDSAALEALRNKDIEVILDVPLMDLESLQDPQEAGKWVQKYILNYAADVKFRYIAVGNEVSPDPDYGTSQYVGFVLPAIQNVYDAIVKAGLDDHIKVSTATYSGLTNNSYPPSQSSFKDNAKGFIGPIIGFLARKQLPLLANIYPYFAYLEGSDLDYALFRATINDYTNLFDAMVDAMSWAVEKAGGPNIEIVVSESGWPSAGDRANPEDAGTYYRNLIQHLKTGNGTPKKPGKAVETYLFAMYDENRKPGPEYERHFGLFNPTNQQQKYQLSF